MKELSLNILDVAENSTAAGASLVEISVDENPLADTLAITIADNGRGMEADFLARVVNPFTTTRTTRPVGMGLPLLKEAAEACGGGLTIKSAPGVGTTVKATFVRSHIDRAPLGDMPLTISALIAGAPQVDFVYRHTRGEKAAGVDTREIRQALGDVALNEPEVTLWIRDYIAEQEQLLSIGENI